MAGHIKGLPPADSCVYKCTAADVEEADKWLATFGKQYDTYKCPRDNHYHFKVMNYVPPQAP